MRTVTGVGDLMQRTGDGRTGRVLSSRVIERSGLSLKTKVVEGFLVWASKLAAMVW
jgi:hypothetical protein